MSRLRGVDGRFKGGWRILFFILTFYALALVATGIRQGLITWLKPAPELSIFITGVLIALVATPAVIFARRRFDKKSFESLGLGRHMRISELLYGAFVSAAMVAVSVGILAMVGWANVTVSDISILHFIYLLFGTSVCIAWFEEIVFRGYLLQNLIETVGLRWAVAISIVLSGGIHAFNPNASVVSTVIISGIVWLHVYGYLATGRLWIPMGTHAAWNLFQGAVFGMPVSGRAHESILATTLTGPSWANGGEFGLEATVFGVAYTLLGFLATWLWARRFGSSRTANGKD